MAQGQIRFGIGFNVDQSGLNQLKASLQEIQKLTVKDLVSPSTNLKQAEQQLQAIQEDAIAVQKALSESFNIKLGTYDIDKFKKSLSDSNTSINKIQQSFSAVGSSGNAAFSKIKSELLSMNKELNRTESSIDKITNTLWNTVRWTIASSVVNNFTGSIEKAYSYVKNLDGALNDIQIVTEKSSEDMAQFAVQANKAAKALGTTTTDYAKASLIYYQQGLSEEDVAARAGITVKAANVTGQSASAVSEQLTAVWNGYKASAQEAELYVDKLAAVAATTAADLEELSTGMSKVASAANTMGVDIDQLNAQLATVISVTRQAPESVGTAFKTIYARMGDIEAGLDTETTLGEYTSQMEAMGFNVLDANRNLRDMGDVIEEIGSKWSTLSREQQVALSQTMAGTRQYNNLLALFDNWDMYADTIKVSADAQGTLQSQNEEYLESMEAHLNKLQASTEGLYDSLFNSKSFNRLLDLFSALIQGAEWLTEAIGGAGTSLTMIMGLLTKIMSKKIAIEGAQLIEQWKLRKEDVAGFQSIINSYNGLAEAGEKVTDELDSMIAKATVLRKKGIISDESYDIITNSVKKIQELNIDLEKIKENQKKADIAFEQSSFSDETIDWEQIEKGDKKSTSLTLEILTEENNKYNDLLSGANQYSELQKEVFEYNTANVKNAVIPQLRIQKDIVIAKEKELGLLKQEENQDQKAIINAERELKLERDKFKELSKQINSYDSARKKLKEGTAGFTKADYEELLDDQNISDTTRQVLKEKFEAAQKANAHLFENNTKIVGPKGQEAGKAFLQALVSAIQEGEANVQAAISGVMDSQEAAKLKAEEEAERARIQAEADNAMRTESINNLVNTASAAMQLSAALSNLGDTLAGVADGTLEVQDVLQSLAGMAFQFAILIPMLIPLVKNLFKSIKAGFKEGASAATKFQAALGWISLALMAISVLIPIITSVIEAINNRQTAEEKAYNSAKKRAEEMQQAYEDAKTAYENLKKTVEDYNNSKTAIDEMTSGTTAWKEEILKANEAALELINSYEGLKWTRDSATGLIIIDEEDLKRVEQESFNKQLLAQNAMLSGKQTKRNAQIDYESEELRRKGRYTNFGTIIQGLFTLIPKELSEGNGVWSQDIDKDDWNKILELDEAILKDEDQFRLALERLMPSQEGLIDSTLELSDDIIQLKQEIEENNRILREENRQKYANTLMGRGYSAEEANVLAGMIAKDQDAESYKNEIEKEAENIKKKYGNNKELVKEWAAAMGIDYETISQTGGANFKYTDSEGNEHTQSYENLAKELARFRIDSAATNWRTVQKQQEKLTKAIEGLSSEVARDIVIQDLSGEPVEAKNAGNYTWADVVSVGEKLGTDSETYKNLRSGFENFEETFGYTEGMSDRVAEVLGATASSISVKTANILSDKLGEIPTKIDWKDIGMQTQIQTADLLASADSIFGKQNSFFKDILTNLSLSSQDISKLSEAFDFTSETFATDTITTLSELGAEIDIADENWFNLLNTLHRANGELFVSREKWAELEKIVKSVNEVGDTISAEDYKKLFINYGNYAEDYFTLMRDGTYALTTAAENFYNVIQEAEKQRVENAYKDILNTLKTIQEQNGNLEKQKEKVKELSKTAVNQITEENLRREYAEQTSVTGTWNGETVSISKAKLEEDGYDSYSKEDAWDIVRLFAEKGTTDAAKNVAAILNHQKNTWDTAGIDYNEDTWKNSILKDTGGNTLALNSSLHGGKYWYIDYEEMVKEILKQDEQVYINSHQQKKISKSEVQTIIEELSEQKLLTEEQIAELNGMLKIEDNLIISSITDMSAIQETITGYLDSIDLKTFKDDELKSYVKSMVLWSDNFKEAQAQIQDDLEKAGKEKVLNEDFWKELRRSWDIQQNLESAEEYENRIKSLESSIEKLESAVENLKSQQEGLFGEDLIEGIHKTNKAIDQEIDAYKELEKVSTSAALKLQLKTGREGKDGTLTTSSDAGYALFAAAKTLGLNVSENADDSSDLLTALGEELGIEGLSIESFDEETYKQLVAALQNKINMTLDEDKKVALQNSLGILQTTFDKYFKDYDSIISNLQSEKYKNIAEAELTIAPTLEFNKKQAEKELDDVLNEYETLSSKKKLEINISANFDAIDKAAEESFKQSKKLSGLYLQDQAEWLYNQGSNYEEFEELTSEFSTMLEDIYNITDADGNINKESVESFYNTMIADEEFRKKYSKEIQLFYERYIEAVELEQEYAQEKIDRELQEKQFIFEQFELKVQIQLDEQQLKKDWNNLMRELTIEEDDYLALNTSYLVDYSNTMHELQTLKDAYAEINSLNITDADKEAKQRELISEIQSKLLEGNELLNTMEENRVSNLESIVEAYEQQMEYIANINSLIEHQLELTELIYGEKAYSQMSKYYKAIVANQINSYKTAQAEYEYLRSQYLQEAAVSGDSDYALELKNKMVQAGEAVAAAISESATAMQEEYINSLNVMMSEFVSIWTNGEDLEALKEEWDWIKDESEAYFDEIDAAFEIQKIANDFQKTINNTTNLNAQERLNKLREEELKALRAKDKLTKYDIDRAKARFEILQAEIALQEAQENKTKMRLMRGADGTYSYQYVADQDKITEQKNKLTELNQKLYDLDKEEYEKNLDSIYDSLEAFLEKYEAALTDGKLEDAERKMLENLWGALAQRVEGNASIMDNLIDSMEQSGIDLANMSEEEIAERFPMLSNGMANLVKTFASGDMAGAFDQFLSMGEQEGAEFQKVLQGLGVDLDAIVSNTITDNRELIASEEDKIGKYQEEQEAVDALAKSIANLREEYVKLAQQMYATYSNFAASDIVIGGTVSPNRLTSETYRATSTTIASMDSGGYTGSWGSSGKLAVLHEEELVLNKEDTSNILSAVNIVRQYSNNLNSIMSNFMKGFDMPMAAWELANDMTIEQNVHITAEFPEATDRDEITAAFEEIINLATQHAFDNTRG